MKEQLQTLQQLYAHLQSQRQALRLRLDSTAATTNKKKSKAIHGGRVTDYLDKDGKERFEWSGMLKTKMKQVWGINEFRYGFAIDGESGS